MTELRMQLFFVDLREEPAFLLDMNALQQL